MEKKTRNILLILGAAAAAGGAYLYYRKKQAEKEAAANLLIAQETAPTNDVINTITQIGAATGGGNTASASTLAQAKKLAADRGTLGKGRQMMTGDIIELQKLLSIFGDNQKFGDTTERVVKQYQGYKGLATDGIVGLGTWTALYSDLLTKQNEAINNIFGLNS
jgi:peptidoglycan hydrolase-like protein with peptidoglycan-binding domain